MIESNAEHLTLDIERGMDRGRKIVLVKTGWPSPIGTVHFDGGHAKLVPREPVKLSGQKVAVPICLARGDRIDADGAALEVLG